MYILATIRNMVTNDNIFVAPLVLIYILVIETNFETLCLIKILLFSACN